MDRTLNVNTIKNLNNDIILQNNKVKENYVDNSQDIVLQHHINIVHNYTSYTSVTVGTLRKINEFSTIINPKKSDSTIIWTIMLNGECHQDVRFVIYKNGSVAPDGMNSVSTNRWVGFVSAFYDNNQDTTPSNWYIQYIDSNVGTTDETTYDLYFGPSSNATREFYLNATYHNFPQGSSARERMVSTSEIMEVRANH